MRSSSSEHPCPSGGPPTYPGSPSSTRLRGNQNKAEHHSLGGTKKIWGTRKSTKVDDITRTVHSLISIKTGLTVKRKYETRLSKGQVETDETENWNGKLKAETEKLKAETEKLKTGNCR